MLILQDVPPLGGVEQWWGGENELFWIANCRR